MGAAETLLARLTEMGWDGIERLLESGWSENLHLEFTTSARNSGRLEKDDRRKFATALSGFANADGGVLLWGITGRRDAEGHDRATSITPVARLSHFVAELEGLTSELVSPVVPRVQHLMIVEPGQDDRGVVMSLIPASDATPHMAIGPGQHTYFKRSGSSFRPLEHYEVADLFGRRPHPKLELSCTWTLRFSSGQRDTRNVYITAALFVSNTGRGLARFVALSLKEPQGGRLRNLPGIQPADSPFRRLTPPRDWWQRFAFSSDDALYPGDTVELGSVVFIQSSTDARPRQDLLVTASVSAEGADTQTLEFTASVADYLPPLERIFGGEQGPFEIVTAAREV